MWAEHKMHFRDHAHNLDNGMHVHVCVHGVLVQLRQAHLAQDKVPSGQESESSVIECSVI